MRLAPFLAFALVAYAPSPARADSVSCGSANKGALADAAELPDEGEGYVIPEPWRSRETHYGTDELVQLVQRAASAVAEAQPGSTLGVGDLSRQRGGPAPGHQSHQSGRDVDLHYYAVDEAGEPVQPDEYMAYFNRRGRAYYARNPVWTRRIPERFFDVARNWELVKALITDPEVGVERIFVSERIERWIVKHARALGEDRELVARAQRLMLRPSDSDPHHDHMHVRIACSEDDISEGRCRPNAKRRKNGKWRRRVRCPKKKPLG